MANNGSRYHAEIKITIAGCESRVNVFADTIPEIFRDLSTIAAQYPNEAHWSNPAKREIANAERIAAQFNPSPDASQPQPKTVTPPTCAHCGSPAAMELIEFTSRKDGQRKRAWKCQQCNEWHYPSRKS